jgi:hypothetical protein
MVFMIKIQMRGSDGMLKVNGVNICFWIALGSFICFRLQIRIYSKVWQFLKVLKHFEKIWHLFALTGLLFLIKSYSRN